MVFHITLKELRHASTELHDLVFTIAHIYFHINFPAEKTLHPPQKTHLNEPITTSS